MSLIVDYYPKYGYGLSRNPYILEINASELATYTVKVAGTTVFTGNGVGSFTVDLSDILEAQFEDTEPPTGTGLLLPYRQGMNDYDFRFDITSKNGESATFEGRVFKGGICKRDYRDLRRADTDIFGEKLNNYSGNFFMTTRTYGWTITVKETEIEPLAFIMPIIPGEENSHIIVRENVTGKSVVIEGDHLALVALNIDAVRKHFFNTFGILANAFDVMDVNHPSRVACRILIEKAPEAVERCAVRFLNSFGVFERIDLIGNATIQTSMAQNEETMFQTLDYYTDIFVKARNRAEIGQTYKVSTGVKRGDELAFIQDMLASDSVYLTLPDGQEVKVIPSVEQNSRDYTQKEPEYMDITFLPVEAESNMTPLRTKYGTSRPRIFTSVFSEQFN